MNVRRGLYLMLSRALTETGFPWDECRHEDRGDGVLVILPATIPKSPLVEAFPQRLRVTGSQDFEWDYLVSLWPLMHSARDDWITTGPGLPTPHDRAAWRRIGAPRHLGYGFGHREAVKKNVCMFGARVQLPAGISLGRIVEDMHETSRLLLTMAARVLIPVRAKRTWRGGR